MNVDHVPGRDEPARPRFRLLRYFTINSLLLACGLLLSLYYFGSMHRESSARVHAELIDNQDAVAREALVRNMEAGNEMLTAVLANQLWDSHISPLFKVLEALPQRGCHRAPGDGRGGADPDACQAAIRKALRAAPEFKTLDAAVLRMVERSRVYKVKIYDLEGLTVYSTDHVQVGEDEYGNKGWRAAAVQGQAVSDLTIRNRFDSAERVVSSRSLIASYLPVRAPRGGEVLGVFEVYSDASELVARLDNSMHQLRELAAGTVEKELESDLWVHGVLMLLFVAMMTLQLVLVARADRIIGKHDAERERIRERMEHMAHHDALTGLPNRYSLRQRLQQSLLLSKRDGVGLAVIFVDLDGFKEINDRLGHQEGDHLLVSVTRRIRSCVRESDIVARLGGDEFVIVLSGINDENEVGALVGKIHGVMTESHELAGSLHHVTASMGVSLYPSDGDGVDTLLSKADSAMYRTKGGGKDGYSFYAPAVDRVARDRATLEQQLAETLQSGGLSLHFQPQVAARTGELLGFEALVRWEHPERGFVPPHDFIEVAEDAGLMDSMSKWVLESACRQLREWRDAGFHCAYLALNLSPSQLASDGLVHRVYRLLQQYRLQGEDLEFEVTETSAMTNMDYVIDQLASLRELGVRLAIDDFGTGYSSLAYLKRLPVDTLKLDRRLVADIDVDSSDAAISRMVVALAHELSLNVVAEGVETEGQRELLRDYGCDVLQGGLIGDPLGADEAAQRWCAPRTQG